MSYPSLNSNPFVKKMAKIEQTMENVARFSGLPRGCVRGTVADVDDPQERGRVRVLFDMVNPNIPQIEGAGTYSQARNVTEEYLSHWIDTSPAFKGKQPPGLVGKRVNVVVSNGQYAYAILQDVLHDKELLTDEAAAKLEIPDNSPMTRLPIYPAGELPLPCRENHGCIVIEDDGPMDADWVCVCLKRDGEYLWVRHADLSHGHAGANDGTQQVDSLGNRQNPVYIGAISANVFPATAQQFKINSSYSSNPPGNPKGERSHWYPPPMSDKVYEPGEDSELLSPDPNIALNFVRNPAAYLPIDASITGFVPKINPLIPTILQSKAQEAFSKAQKLLAIGQDAKKIIENPTGFVIDQAISAADGIALANGIPPATKVALEVAKNPGGFLATKALSAIAPAAKGIFDGVKGALSSIV